MSETFMNDGIQEDSVGLEEIAASALLLPTPLNDFAGVSGRLTGLPFQVLMFSRVPRVDCAPDLHYRYLWIIALEGAGQVLVDGRPHAISAGQRLLVYPFERHAYRFSDDSRPLRCLFIGFELPVSHEIAGLRGVVSDLQARDWKLLASMIDRYMVALNGAGDDIERRLSATALVTQLALSIEWSLIDGEQLEEVKRSQRSEDAQRIVEKVWLFAYEASPAPIRDDCSRCDLAPGVPVGDITRSYLARRLGVSASRLRDVIYDYARTSPREFVRRIRMQRAGIWLLEYGLPVHQVALNAGYTESAAFSNEFKKVMGTRPSVLLKEFAVFNQHRIDTRRLNTKPPFTSI